jgi:hypothetical protein
MRLVESIVGCTAPSTVIVMGRSARCSQDRGAGPDNRPCVAIHSVRHQREPLRPQPPELAPPGMAAWHGAGGMTDCRTARRSASRRMCAHTRCARRSAGVETWCTSYGPRNGQVFGRCGRINGPRGRNVRRLGIRRHRANPQFEDAVQPHDHVRLQSSAGEFGE